MRRLRGHCMKAEALERRLVEALRRATRARVRLVPARDERHARPSGSRARDPRVQLQQLRASRHVEQDGQRLRLPLLAYARGLLLVRTVARADGHERDARLAQGFAKPARGRALRTAEENDVLHKKG